MMSLVPLIGAILLFALKVFFWIIIVQVVLSWLIAFGVVNLSNPQAANLVRLVERITHPVYAPLRRFIPAIAGIDITPIIVIFGISLLQRAIYGIFFL